ncbi:LysR family transcriptional regulator [Vibrio sp. DW001]|uniref:LysR family transcriptional regulator n=1 Tax=Vibrio sp. DW001 TaxID=2912315 RepID=UPI0023AEEA29|nr:LysR family transcriptional regulator [Vibrio sp. DW001]WED27037.1 LysR family transcriptional regulator [Vibrio sp. DW001]
MLDNVNLNLLRSLLILLEECHVTRSAERLNITQSAVSRQLAQLRNLFDDPLLIRDGNELYKTPKAVELKVKLEQLFGEFKYLIEEQSFEPEKWAGEVSFSCSDYVAQYIFPEIVKKVSGYTQTAKFNYHLWQPHLIDSFANSPIKLASTLLANKPKGLSGKLIGEDNLVCVMRNTHPLSHKNELILDDILSFQHVMITGGGDKNSEFDARLSALKRSRDIGLKVPFYSAALSSLINTDYLLVIPQHIARNMCAHLPISYYSLPIDLPVQRYWLIWHPKYDNEPSHQWVRELSYEILRNSIYSVGYDSN